MLGKRTGWKLVSVLFLTGCASGPAWFPKGWETVPQASVVGDYCVHVGCAAKPSVTNIRVSGNRLFNGSKPLTPAFAAIDSYDVSLDRKEIVFSAKRTNNFDVGLVSIDGSDIHWIPEDPADEVSVQWAPRGNKVSYILETATGSIVRTVHIPTGTPLSVDLPRTQLDALGWEPQAERFTLVIESPDASQHLVSMTYAGEQRQELVASSDWLAVSLDPIGGVLVMRPNEMRYNEKLPLVIWLDPKPFAWSDARAALMRSSRVAIAIAPGVDDRFINAIRNVPWIDSNRTYIVDPTNRQADIGATIIATDARLPLHHYTRNGNTVRVRPAVVQSFAAAFIADDLKGTPPPNGRR
ncbi:MAG: hypothetical protein JO088_11470 [Acidobacteria bacterium]|nr:hypothetical protein [Acidobacteriota bacterium]